MLCKLAHVTNDNLNISTWPKKVIQSFTVVKTCLYHVDCNNNNNKNIDFI